MSEMRRCRAQCAGNGFYSAPGFGPDDRVNAGNMGIVS